MNAEREIAFVNSEVECKRLRFALEEIADPVRFLSLDLNLKKSNLSLQEWAKAILSNTLKWDRGFMIIIEGK